MPSESKKRYQKTVPGGVLFLVATRAQTQDALHVIHELDPTLAVTIFTIFPRGSRNYHIHTLLDKESRYGPVQVIHTFGFLPKSFDQLLQIFAVRHQLKKLTKKYGHSLLVVGDDICPVERSTIAYARKYSIQSLLIQDGILIDPKSGFEYSEKRRSNFLGRRLIRRILGLGRILPDLTAYGASNCDTFAVWGEGTRRMMIDFGIWPEKIVIVGSPRMDKWIKMRQQRAPDLPDRSKCKILFTSLILSTIKFGTDDEDRHVMGILDALAEKDPSLDIIVRPHPSEKTASYRRLFSEMNIKRLRIDRESSLQKVLLECDLILTYVSTVAVEGMILGKPVICLPIEKSQTPIFSVEGAAVFLEELEKLQYWINALLHDDDIIREYKAKRREFLEKHVGILDGKSSHRAARLIERSLRIGEA